MQHVIRLGVFADVEEKLRDLHHTNDPFWTELNCPNARHLRPLTDAIVVEDIITNPEDEDEIDDSAVSLQNVVVATHRKPMHKKSSRISVQENGGLATTTDAENINIPVTADEEVEVEEGRGKRRKTANRLYRLADFARHWDNEASDVE